MQIDKDDFEKVEIIIKKYEKEINLSIHISNAEFIERQKIVQKELKKRGIDVGIFFFYREMPGDGLYLTGYDPTIERSAGFIGQEGGPTVLAGPEAGLVARESGKGKRVSVAFVEEFAIPDEHYEGAVYHTLEKLLKTSAGKDSIKKIGLLTGKDLIPVSLLENLKKSVPEDVEFVNAEDILKELRLEKSESEFACMKQANIIACAAMRAALAVIKPGLKESQLAAVGDYVMKSLGAQGYGVESIVSAGDNCRTIVSPASNDVIKKGDMVQMGFCPNYQGYKGISRRVVIAGEPSAIQQEYLDRIS
ncbi:MAG: M24 family metallopeptidase, partial [Spirochaetaceae bacterium]|nr:M24 family metallopeptidase [Spirochaetaceae bacterium]